MTNEFTQLLTAGGGVAAIFFVFIPLIWFALCIILFFKVWAMTNDVSRIKDLLEEQMDLEHPYIEKDEKEVKS